MNRVLVKHNEVLTTPSMLEIVSAFERMLLLFVTGDDRVPKQLHHIFEDFMALGFPYVKCNVIDVKNLKCNFRSWNQGDRIVYLSQTLLVNNVFVLCLC